MLYIISDIHGCLREFKEMLGLIGLKKTDRLVLLGDYIDRGNDGLGVIGYIRQLIENGYDVKPLMGNHEEMLLGVLKKHSSMESLEEDEYDFYLAMRNGMIPTLSSYYALTGAERDEMVRFIESLDMFYELGSHIFVHAGISPNKEMKEQREDDMLWIREQFIENSHGLNKTVVFGHTPTGTIHQSGDFRVWNGGDKIGVDCGCVFGKRLGCLRLDDMREYYVERVL